MDAEVKEIEISGKRVLGVRVELPGAPLLLVVAPRGYVMCGYLNIETAVKLGQAAAVVRGVKTFEELMEAKVTAVTPKASEIGVKEGMCGREAVEKML